ncbi:MAG: RNA polymerase factor sigma-32 [Deltaproteobacteria bacterium]|nr:RNA polymerase factor sigma-32 [Deltaproteobacteria bacterium]
MSDQESDKKKQYQYPVVKQDSVDLYFQQISRIPILSPEEEKELAQKWYVDGDKEAGQKLVISNLRFVVKIAREYSKYGIKMSDLIQEGNMGLMHAVDKFDPDKGYRLITYAVWWIRAYIQSFVLRSLSIVRSGTTRAQRRVLNGLQKAQKRIATMQGANLPVTTKQLANELEVSVEEVQETMALLSKRDVSTEKNVSKKDSSLTFGDTLKDESQSVEEKIIRHDVDERVQHIIQDLYDDLAPRERYLLEHRMLADEPMTLEAVGHEFGVTRERVRQLESRLKKKLKKSFENAGLTGDGWSRL